jgi:argininosuccinate lyase
VDTLELALAAATGMIRGATFDRERMAAAASDDLIAATDIADLYVKRGMPFREAHGIVGGLVREAVESGRPLAEIESEHLDEEARGLLERSSWLESKDSEGGTAGRRVREQLQAARDALAAAPAV